MADVRPFPALRYAPAEPLEAFLAPPYDVLSDTQVAELRARSPHNVVHITRPGTDYEGAARLFAEWVRSGVVTESEPAMFVHETTFDPPAEMDGSRAAPGVPRTRLDLIAALRLQPYEDRVVLPHERTHRGPKEDRLALMRATHASLEPLWFVYEGRASGLKQINEVVSKRSPAVAITGPESTDDRPRTITDRVIHAAVHAAFEGMPVLIADGHHRYETALAYAEEVGGPEDASSRFTLALLTDIDDPGLEVLPTHRVLKAGVTVTGGEQMPSLDATLAAIRNRVAVGAYHDHQFQVLPLEGEMALVELHEQVIDNILGKRNPEDFLMYTRDAAQAVRWVDEAAGTGAFFLDTPDLRQVLKLAQEGKTLPQKSTYFYPKPPSGMVFLRLEPNRRL